jgi:hypothetical protein
MLPLPLVPRKAPSPPPLHNCVDSLDAGEEIARLLIARGADVDALNVYGETPLHLPCRASAEDAAKTLLFNGADVHARDKDGTMVSDLMQALGMHETLAWHEAFTLAKAEVDVLVALAEAMPGMKGQTTTRSRSL